MKGSESTRAATSSMRSRPNPMNDTSDSSRPKQSPRP
ncbi:unnamed protein product, partial [Mesorhabditis spiculigera]